MMLQQTLEHFKQLLVPALTDIKGVNEQGLMANQALINKLSAGISNPTNTHATYTDSPHKPLSVALNQYLAAAVHNTALPKQLQPLAHSLLAMSPYLQWYQRQPASNGNAYPEPFASGHANAYIIGQRGLEQRHDLAVGITLIAPNITYVDHRHPPEEIYLVLSDGHWRQAKKPWHTPTAGGVVYNPPNIIHAMQSTEVPLLAIWCLNWKV